MATPLNRILYLRHSAGSLGPAARCLTTESRSEYDLVVVGGGIVGVATAREILSRHPKLRVAIAEKESKLAAHQSGHNSGVIHAGIYYKPGSLKAKLCVEGLRMSYKYFDERNIPYKKVGKLIVATNEKEIVQLNDLHERGKQNQVPDLQMLSGKEIQEVEPFCKGLKALWSPQTGIVDWELVTHYYSDDFKNGGGKIHLNFEVNGITENPSADYPVVVRAKNGNTLATKFVLTCGGLHSDKIAELSGCPKEPRVIPFRGEYLLLNPEKCHMIKGNIYPVPNPKLPFLGVHFTPRMDGSVWLGPNAVLAFRREGYTWFDIKLDELIDALMYPGLRRMAFKYTTAGAKELMKSAFLSLQVRELKKYIPNITAKDVTRGPAGVRAQAIDPSGALIDDFVFNTGKGNIGKRVLHCRNAPSPGATSSMSIAKMMADKLEAQFGLV